VRETKKISYFKFKMYLIPLVSTLLSSVFCGALPLVSRNLGHRGVAVFSIFSLTISFVSSAFIWVDLYIGSAPVWLDLFGPWFEVGTVTVSWIFYFDLLTAHMLFTVTSVSLAVHIFAIVYMRSDPHLSLFMSYLSLFTFFMLVYVCGDNLLVMLVGWEGIFKCRPFGFQMDQCPNGFEFYYCFIGLNLGYKQAPVDPLKGVQVCPTIAQSCGRGLEPLAPQPLVGVGAQGLRGCQAAPVIGTFQVSKRSFYKEYISAAKRIGPHTKLFNEILTGFLLGDGNMDKHGDGARLSITMIDKYRDVAEMYHDLLVKLGYIGSNHTVLPPIPLVRSKILKPNAKPYFQVRTMTFASLLPYWEKWYNNKIKLIPRTDVEDFLTPLCLAIWVMGDGAGMNSGAFKLCSHSFTRGDNEFLCSLLAKKYGLKTSIHNHGSKGQNYIYIWKESVPELKKIVSPYLKTSCDYKFRFSN
jgi:hypothetical protein